MIILQYMGTYMIIIQFEYDRCYVFILITPVLYADITFYARRSRASHELRRSELKRQSSKS